MQSSVPREIAASEEADDDDAFYFSNKRHSGSVSSQVVARACVVGQQTVEPDQLVRRGES
jgi:hypothetical protein